MADLFMAVTSLAWGVAGLTVAVVPALGSVWSRRMLLDPWPRFWFGQAVLLMGLLLMIGTTNLAAFWLWAVCGALAVIKACLLLGAPVSRREWMRQWLGGRPSWLYRVSGSIGLVLAVGLAADLILHG